MSVEQQPREAVCEVLDEASRELAQCLVYLSWELPVVVLLRMGRTKTWISYVRASLIHVPPRL